MSDYYVPADGEMPEYFNQLLGMLVSFRSEDPTAVQQAIFTVMGNAMADDGTDRKLDMLSAALFMMAGYHAMPGSKDGMPLDPGFIDALDGFYRDAYPHLHRPGLVERQFNWFLNGQMDESDLGAEEEAIFGLLCRVALIVAMTEQLRDSEAAENGEADQVGEMEGFMETLAGLMCGAVELMHEWRRDERLPGDWELPTLR